MGGTLTDFRAKYPAYDAVPDSELAAAIIKKYPAYGESDLMDDARDALVKDTGVIEASRESTSPTVRGLSDVWQTAKTIPRDLVSAFKPQGEGSWYRGLLQTLRGVGNVVDVPFRAAGEVAGAVTNPLTALMSQATSNPEREQERLRQAVVGSVENVPQAVWGAKGVTGAGALARGALETGPSYGAIPKSESLLTKGTAAGTEAYLTPRPARAPRPSSPELTDPYRLLPQETPELLPRPGPTTDIMPTAYEAARQKTTPRPDELRYAIPQRPGLVTETGQPIGSVGFPMTQRTRAANIQGPLQENARVLYNQRGSVDPYVAFAAARAAGGAAVGASMGDTGIDKIRFGALGAGLGLLAGPAGGKAALAVGRSAMSRWRNPNLGLTADERALHWAPFKTKISAVLTPEEVARGNMPATNIVREGWATTEFQKTIETGFVKNLRQIYAPLGRNQESVIRIHRALDGQPVPLLTPLEISVARDIRAAFDDMANRVGLPVAQRLRDYFPHLRDEIHSTIQLEIKTDLDKAVVKSIPQDYKVFFEKRRTLPADETLDYGLRTVEAYARAAAKRIAVKGGLDLEGQTVEGFLTRVQPHLASLPEVPELRTYFKTYINDMVRGPGRKAAFLTPQQASAIKQVEFMRTIGLNALSPVTNTMQQLNTFAVVDPRSFIAAYYDLSKSSKIRALAEKSGVVSESLSRADLHSLSNPDRLNRILETGTKAGGWLFGKAEKANRLHAFAAGYRDAMRAGLKGDDAIQYAKDIVNRTQFRFGMDNAPGWMRGASTDLSVVGQFKTYQINQMLFLKNLVLHNPKGAAKWALGVSLLGGPDALLGSDIGHTLRKTAADMFGGDPTNYQYRGALGNIGIYIGQQIGLGAVPVENLSSLFFLLPGPALSHIMDAASVAANRNLNITGLADGTFGKPLTPEQWASKATSLTSIQLNRIRKAAVMGSTEGSVTRQPRNLSEATGFTAPTGRAGRPFVENEALWTAAGIPSTTANEEWDKRQRIRTAQDRYRQLSSEKALAILARDIEAIKLANEQGLKEFGRYPVVSTETLKGAALSTKVPAQERALRSTPRPIRRRVRQEVND